MNLLVKRCVTESKFALVFHIGQSDGFIYMETAPFAIIDSPFVAHFSLCASLNSEGHSHRFRSSRSCPLKSRLLHHFHSRLLRLPNRTAVLRLWHGYGCDCARYRCCCYCYFRDRSTIPQPMLHEPCLLCVVIAVYDRPTERPND